MSIIAPANVISMWQIIIPIVMFDILESIPLIQNYFPDSEEDMKNSGQVLDQMIDIGYDSFNTILNLGTLFVALAYWIARVFAHIFVIWPLWRIGWISGTRRR